MASLDGELLGQVDTSHHHLCNVSTSRARCLSFHWPLFHLRKVALVNLGCVCVCVSHTTGNRKQTFSLSLSLSFAGSFPQAAPSLRAIDLHGSLWLKRAKNVAMIRGLCLCLYALAQLFHLYNWHPTERASERVILKIK